MFSTSTDILILVAAIAIAVLTFFIAWMIYYFIRILKQTNKMVDEIKEKVEKFGDILDTLKQKISDSFSNLGLLTKAVARFIDFFKERKANKGKAKRKVDSDF